MALKINFSALKGKKDIMDFWVDIIILLPIVHQPCVYNKIFSMAISMATGGNLNRNIFTCNQINEGWSRIMNLAIYF